MFTRDIVDEALLNEGVSSSDEVSYSQSLSWSVNPLDSADSLSLPLLLVSGCLLHFFDCILPLLTFCLFVLLVGLALLTVSGKK